MNSTIKFGLSAKDCRLIENVFRNYESIRVVVIYGSRAMGQFQPGSDIDLTIIASDFTLSDLFRLKNDLDDLNLPYKFDLSNKDQIENPNLIDHINRVGQIFYQKE